MNNRKNPELRMKLAFVAIGIIAVLAIIFGSWVWNLAFSPETFDLNTWANNAVFNSCLSLGTMVLGFVAVRESMKGKEDGKYQSLLDAFNALVEGLYESGRIVWFDEFVPWLAQRQAREKKVSYLTKHGMGRREAEAVVDNATVADIPTLSGIKPGERPSERFGSDIVRKNREGEEVFIPAIKGTWACYVEDVLTDKISVDVDDPSYYLSASKDRGPDLTSLEKAQAADRDRVRSLRVSIISKIAIGLVYSALFSMFAVDRNSGIGTSEALWNLVFRLTVAALGLVCGGFTGDTDVRFLCKWIKDKMKVVRDFNEYCNSGEFKPRSFEERAEKAKAKAREITSGEVKTDLSAAPAIELALTSENQSAVEQKDINKTSTLF